MLRVKPHELLQYRTPVLLASLCSRICPQYSMCSLILAMAQQLSVGFLSMIEILCASFYYIWAVLLVTFPLTVSRFLPVPSHSASWIIRKSWLFITCERNCLPFCVMKLACTQTMIINNSRVNIFHSLSFQTEVKFAFSLCCYQDTGHWYHTS